MNDRTATSEPLQAIDYKKRSGDYERSKTVLFTNSINSNTLSNSEDKLTNEKPIFRGQQSLRPSDVTHLTYTTVDFFKAITANIIIQMERKKFIELFMKHEFFLNTVIQAALFGSA